MKETIATILVLVALVPCTASAGETETGGINETSKADGRADPAVETDLDRMRDRVERAERAEELLARMQRVEEKRTRRLGGRAEESASAREWARPGRVVLGDLAGVKGSWSEGLRSTGVLAVDVKSSDSTRIGGLWICFEPSIDVLITKRWTVGGALEIARQTGANMEGIALGAKPRVGFLVPLGPFLLWPKLEVGARLLRSDYEVGGGGPGTQTSKTLRHTVEATARLDVIFPVHRNVFLSMGPELTYAHDSLRGVVGDPSNIEVDRVLLAMRAGIGLTF